jgi:hypothetical protein
VDEPEFRGRLEYRICGESGGFSEDHFRCCWCDDLVPERYNRHGGQWQISGSAWIETLNAPRRHELPGQEPRKFTLIAGHARDRNEIDGQELLPGDRLTGWLTPDPDNKTLKIDPAAGYHD